MGFLYRIASASEYLAITGYGINDVKIAKKAWIKPGQQCTRFDITPVNYTFEVQAMSAEKLPFILPAVFTIGPRSDDGECLLRYARLMSSHDKLSPPTSTSLSRASSRARPACSPPQ
jgi:flotillin